MSFRKFASIVALALSASLPSLALAAPTGRAPCLLSEYQVTSVSPYLQEDHIGKASFPRVHGASIYVAAEPGLTAEWLKLRVERHLAQMRNVEMPDCALDIDNVRVEVDSAGNGFAVRLISSNPKDAAEILNRARLLVAK